MHLKPGKLLFLLIMSLQALAAEGDLRLNGFATFGLYKANDANASVSVDTRQPTGSRNNWLTDGDTMIGGQAAYGLTSTLEMVGQILSKRDANNSFYPRIEWAYLAWTPTDEVNIKLGRAVPDVRLISSVRNVGYAQTLARPSELLYGSDAITNIDGLTGSFRKRIGSVEINPTGFIGKNDLSTASAKTIVHPFYGAALKLSSGNFSARFGAARYKFDLSAAGLTTLNATLTNLSRTYCENCRELINEHGGFNAITAKTNSFSLVYDDSEWSITTELSQTRSDSLWVLKANNWYVQAARSFGQFTPYLAYARLNDTQGELNLKASTGAPSSVIGLLNNLNRTKIVGDPSASSWTVGMRWDPKPNLAVKAQLVGFTFNKPQIVGTRTLVRVPISDLQFDGRVNLFSLTADTVF